ncbi:MAG: UDP-2,4-diacetamido-2,4,6-trideoxy-beta-L-altropyranose hydrolase [Sulfurimonadaceae bacterium]
MQNILFRADSSSTIGTGHIMRDLILAKQYADANIIFATQALAGNINAKIEEDGYKIKTVRSNDLEELSSIIKNDNIDLIIIDHYGIDATFERRLKEKHPQLHIMVLDDTYEQHFCDALLNHNVYADATRYKGLVPEYCELKCGAAFTLLRDEFVQEKRQKKKHSNNVFLAMGGADHSNINIEILKVLENFPDLHINVVTTTANQHITQLKNYATSRQNMTLHINTKHIAKLMHEADVAIVSPSVTLNEIIFMETPFIAIKTAENQIEMYHYLVENSYPVLKKFDAQLLEKQVKGLLHD